VVAVAATVEAGTRALRSHRLPAPAALPLSALSVAPVYAYVNAVTGWSAAVAGVVAHQRRESPPPRAHAPPPGSSRPAPLPHRPDAPSAAGAAASAAAGSALRLLSGVAALVSAATALPAVWLLALLFAAVAMSAPARSSRGRAPPAPAA
jgi:hypothetical protein